ncbi:Iron-regulated protein A precursor [Ruegeria denitrificans]|uniref:Iron-regulated protein A n=1 Tax=Ruegeria denitrificans TaxID=1715692 RepID=A0A0P1IL61_9RHOB|nr:imelysin family protein [Ruegeria denitrificans]CUK09717.1 Iron-regulated protein A precursor [Ruegeria denitrificans]
MRILIAAVAVALPFSALAQDRGPILSDVVERHIIPGFASLADATGALTQAAQTDCSPNSPDLRAAYHTAFDDWISVSHLRFGPTEVDDRAFALAFWPDTKGFTPKALSGLISNEDAAVESPEEFAETSVAGRGFFALEQMLFDPKFSDQGNEGYRCALIRAITTDIDDNARAINADWGDYATALIQPGDNALYRSDDEALQELYKALVTGLEFTGDTRLGRPMGTFDRPRPNRAEARRSDRSLRHVELSLIALRDLSARLSVDHPEIADDLDSAFDKAIIRAQSLNDPALAGVATPRGRIRVEALQQAINDIRTIASTKLGPTLGINAGFNSLDGD